MLALVVFGFRSAVVYKPKACFKGQEAVKNNKKLKKYGADSPMYVWAKYGCRAMFSDDILVKVFSEGELKNKYIIAKHGKCSVNNILLAWNPDKTLGKYCDRKEGVAFFKNDYSSKTMLPFDTVIGPAHGSDGCDHHLIIATHGVARWVQAQRGQGGNAVGALAGAGVI